MATPLLPKMLFLKIVLVPIFSQNMGYIPGPLTFP